MAKRVSTIDDFDILGQKFDVVAHHFVRPAGQAKVHPKNINTRKQKPALFSVGILQKRTQNTDDKNQEKASNFTLQFFLLWLT